MRYALTDVGGSEQRIYERIHCLRGNAENRWKEPKAGLGLDRTICRRFLGNQSRVLLAAAHLLLRELLWRARWTAFERATVPRVRDILLKIAVWVRATVVRVLLHLPQGAPARAEWLTIVRRLGAGAAGQAGLLDGPEPVQTAIRRTSARRMGRNSADGLFRRMGEAPEADAS